MSTATAEPERLVSAPEDHVVFMSRRSDLYLVKMPRYPKYGPGGQKVGEDPGEAVQFRDGQLKVPLKGKMTLADGREVTAASIRKWLEEHRLFTDKEDGFWRVDPVAPAVSPDELRAFTEVIQAFDEDRLREFIQQERDGWAREELLAPAEEALGRLRAFLKAQAEQAGS